MTACKASSSEKQRFVVRQELKAFILETIKKIFNKSPTNYPLTAELAALDPVIFLSGSRTSIDKITNLVSLVNTARLVSDSDCEVIINQYRTARDLALEKGCEFSPGTRLDDFWAGLLETSGLKEVWGLTRQLLLLSHGQASVERGFSDNAATSTTNLKGHTLVAQRQICDLIKQVGGLEHVQISDALLALVGQARGQYQAHLDEEKAQKAATQVEKEKKQMEERIEEIKGKLRREELSKAA